MGGDGSDKYYEDIRLVNLRLVKFDVYGQFSISRVLSPVNFPWNLQTLMLQGQGGCYTLDIWKMPPLRLVMTNKNGGLCLSRNPPLTDKVVLENLQRLSHVLNLNLGEGVLRRIPNIRVLKLDYYLSEEEAVDYSLNNLHRLHKLQVLSVHCSSASQFTRELTLPYSLKKLTLSKTKLPWEVMETKIGCLPLLQVLKLDWGSFTGSEWETVEGQFSSLKYLLIDDCRDLEHWITDDNTHFPRLEHLVLSWLTALSEIPSSIGDIPTLRSIRMKYCSDSAVESARRIVEEQEELGNEDLQLQVES